jgi:hypothetical protein
MQAAEVLRLARSVAEAAGQGDGGRIDPSNFLDFANLVRDIVTEWPEKRRLETPWFNDFARGLRELRDDFLKIVEADPMVIYKPAHKAALEFHQSEAYIRYFRAPNRTSKTQSGVADNYWVLTGQHPYRPRPPLPASVAIVAINFSKLASAVYVPKYIEGEAGNPLSPAFPDGGKWFYHWDSRKHLLKLACPACAEAGKAGSCKHPKSTLQLFSDVEGPAVLQGGQYSQVQFDEQITYPFFAEAIKRLETVPNSGLIVTETPLGGRGFWTHQILTRDAEARKRIPGTDRIMVSLHTLSQYEAGLTAKEQIDASRELMTEQEAEARVFGRPAAYSATAVFDNAQVGHMMADAKPPIARGRLVVEGELPDGKNTEDILSEIGFSMASTGISIVDQDDGNLRVWEEPKKNEQYLIGADVSQGLIKGDASCAQVIKLSREGANMEFELVASYHGWINSITYAFDLMKLGLWYNQAHLVPERRGPGDATIQKLKDMGCWFLFRDTTDPANAMFIQDARFGLDTNVKTKGVFISMLQRAIWDKSVQRRWIKIYDRDTCEELGTYGQQVSKSGKTITFAGEGGMPDDRVMALAIAVYAANAFPVYSMSVEREKKMDEHVERGGLSSDDVALWKSVRREEKLAGDIDG